MKISNDECDAINLEFSKHLRNKCTKEQLQNFCPKDEHEVIWNMEHPFKMNGFHPAFMWHFTEFIDEQKKLADVQS